MDILIVLGILLLVFGGIGYNLDKDEFFSIVCILIIVVSTIFGVTLLAIHGISFPVWGILLLILVLCIGV